MPNYLYACHDCEQAQIVSRMIAEEEKKPDCPKCNNPMSRQYTAPITTFKGSGFYSTDNKTPPVNKSPTL